MGRSGISRDQFRKQILLCQDRHRRGAGGIRTALRLTTLHDALLRSAYNGLSAADRAQFAVIALGGYGRRELCFHSDIDVMLLVRDSSEHAQTAVERYLHSLLDYGLNIGHSVRTPGDCVAISRDDLESRLSLLESRRVCGSARLYADFRRTFDKFIESVAPADFVRQMSTLLDRRHAKYGNSAKLLEPNIKNSAGGLRDLHTAYWLLRGIGALRPLSATATTDTAILSMLRTRAVRSLLRPDLVRDVHRAFDFLLRIRNEMHLHSQALNDTLAFTLQTPIAAGLRYRAGARRSTVERFMQEYYVASRNAAHLTGRVQSWAADRWMRPEKWTNRCTLDETFELRHARLHLRHGEQRLTNEQGVRAFAHAAQHQTAFSFPLEDALHRSERTLRPIRQGAERDAWNTLFNAPHGIAAALHRMNSLGLLATWIPEWKPLVAFFQHNQYHFYTADEHTLLVLANAEALRTQQSAFAHAYRLLPRLDILRWACLLHDIAKPVRLSTHEIAGVPITRSILARIGASAIADDVAFLVRHHLLMEQVAFRRNLNDPQTIHEFAEKFERAEQLDYLFVLTYADLSAVNHNVLTEWKTTLLHDLYRKAREAITSRMSREELQQRSRRQSDELVRTVVASLAGEFPERLVENHLSLIDNPSYLTAFTTDEIRGHIQLVIHRPLVKARYHHRDTITDITIVARDAPFALARFCGILSANDANILDAGIFTRRDGIIIDRFRVADFASQAALSPDQCERITKELTDVFGGRTDLRHLLARHRAKWKRRSKQLNPNIRLDVAFENHPQFTIIDVYAADTLGFLYRITESISHLGLNIAFAKISTRGDGIVDSFYVTDESGQRITGQARLESIRRTLLETVQETAGTELIVG